MSLSLVRPQATDLKPRIVVFGVGGAGGNAVNNMIDAGLEGVEFVVANTDAQHLSFAKTDRRVQLGGEYNMFDPRAVSATGLSESEYCFVLKNYVRLREAAEAVDN
jgi:hypothetical protein